LDKNFKLGFIGVGNMGSAIIAGVLKNVLLPTQNIVITDIDKDRVSLLREQFGVIVADGIDELLSKVDATLYAAKPQDAPQVFPEISNAMSPNQWLISIAAGVKTGTLEEYLPGNTPVVRVMPSITASVGAGAAAICGGKYATDEHLGITQELFTSVGKAIVMEEKLLDAVTGLSGSGPAFVFLFIEALADAGVQVGLSRQDATTLAVQTVLGASKMVEQTVEHPAILKNRVTSPGGTTAAGLYELESGGLRVAIANAVIAATTRSTELAT
jgi:pyrroline-5-carboxylate reductase